MSKFCIYLRVSTKKQGATGLGLDAQRTICESFINAKLGECVAEFQDIESGTHRERRGLWDAIDYCKANNCTLVIAKLDRLARDVEFTFRVLNSGIQILFCDMPIMNTMVLGVFASVAQYERELCSSRTKAALNEIKEEIAENGGHMSKANRWIKNLGRVKGSDTMPAAIASAIVHTKKANAWKESSPLYIQVKLMVKNRTPRKKILEEAETLYKINPSMYGTREGKMLSKGVLSRWIKDMKL